MSSLRQLRRRIKSVQNTKKITRAMEMVAAAKLRRFEDLLLKARQSAGFMERLLKNLLADVETYTHPLFLEREKKEKIGLVVFSSDTGLCGTYNANVFHAALDFLKEHQDKTVKIIPIGKNSVVFFKRRGDKMERSFVEIRASNFESTVEEAAESIKNAFLSGDLDEVYLLYTHFESKASYKPKIEKFLNLEKKVDLSQEKVGYILEPNPQRVFEELLPQFLHSKMRTTLLEAMVSEQLSRMVAMRQATDNATEMIDDLTLLRNKLRQAAITKELIEVVSGAKALKH